MNLCTSVDGVSIPNCAADASSFGSNASPKLKDQMQKFSSDADPVVAALVNHRLVSLNTAFCESSFDVKPVHLSSMEGMEVYKESLIFLLAMSCREAFPACNLRVCHAFGLEHSLLCTGYFFIIENKAHSPTDAKILKERMQILISKNVTISPSSLDLLKNEEYFKDTNQKSAHSFISSRNLTSVDCFKCLDFSAIAHIPLVCEAGILKTFDIVSHEDGFIISFPSKQNLAICEPVQCVPAVSSVLKESRLWNAESGWECIGDVNKLVMEGKSQELVQICEARQQQQIMQLAQRIAALKDVKAVMIAGPSSSGKTTFATKLGIALKAEGLSPITLGTDDYYKPHSDPFYPRDAAGHLDFESIDALRCDLLNDQLLDLFRGETIGTPIFDFVKGHDKDTVRSLTLPEGGILIMEGIFCLHPKLTERIPHANKFMIYISPFSGLNADDFHFPSNQEVRVIRRISRDYLTRGRGASETLRKWSSVRLGEERNIFPYIQYADCVFNSSLDYEISVLKVFVQPLLETIKPSNALYPLAIQLMDFLTRIFPISERWVPNTAILREFIGGSAFVEPQPVEPYLNRRKSDILIGKQVSVKPSDRNIISQTVASLIEPSSDRAVVAALVNGETVSLNLPVKFSTAAIAPVFLDTSEGMAVYRASLSFLLALATSVTFPQTTVYVRHGFGVEGSSFSQAYFCTLNGCSQLTEEMLKAIKLCMTSLVARDLPITIEFPDTQSVKVHMRETKRPYSVAYLESHNFAVVRCYKCEDFMTIAHDVLLPSLGFLKRFDLRLHGSGFLLCFPSVKELFTSSVLPFVEPCQGMQAALKSALHWSEVLDYGCVGTVNLRLTLGEGPDIIHVIDAVQQKRIFEIAEIIHQRRASLKVIMIAGPSCSGKSNFASSLAIHLRALGVTSVVLGTDNYYRASSDPLLPKNSSGMPDFECMDALRIDVLNENLLALINGEVANTPLFDYIQKKPKNETRKVTLEKDGVVIVEGLFCLNDKITHKVQQQQKFKIYVAPMAQMAIDELHFCSAKMCRVLRRVSRDHLVHGRRAPVILQRWFSVCEGEEKSIFPFIQNADEVFNSSIGYEFPVLKTFVVPLLEEVKSNQPEYALAVKMKGFINRFHPFSEKCVSSTSLLREFIDSPLV